MEAMAMRKTGASYQTELGLFANSRDRQAIPMTSQKSAAMKRLMPAEAKMRIRAMPAFETLCTRSRKVKVMEIDQRAAADAQASDGEDAQVGYIG